MSIYSLINRFNKYSDNYSKIFEILYKSCRGEPRKLLTDSKSFKFKSRF